MGIRSYYWGRQSVGDRVPVSAIMYYLALGCHLRWTQAANSEALLGLNTENPRVEKHLSLRFGISYCGFPEMSVPGVYSTSSAALISCLQYLLYHSGGETGGFSLSYHYDASLLLTNSSKIICRSNRKGKTFSFIFFPASYPIAVYLECVSR